MSEILATLLTASGLGLSAGLNAYATLLVFGLLARFYPSWVPGEGAELFASTPMLILLAVLYAVEFFADKFPAIDHAWDAIHTFIRPLAGAIVAFASAKPGLSAGLVIAATILGGSAALGGHAAKSTLRVTSTATTGGTMNPLLSVAEDLFAILQSIVAILLPYLMAVILVLIVIPLAIVLAILVRRRRDAPAPAGR